MPKTWSVGSVDDKLAGSLLYVALESAEDTGLIIWIELVSTFWSAVVVDSEAVVKIIEAVTALDDLLELLLIASGKEVGTDKLLSPCVPSLETPVEIAVNVRPIVFLWWDNNDEVNGELESIEDSSNFVDELPSVELDKALILVPLSVKFAFEIVNEVLSSDDQELGVGSFDKEDDLVSSEFIEKPGEEMTFDFVLVSHERIFVKGLTDVSGNVPDSFITILSWFDGVISLYLVVLEACNLELIESEVIKKSVEWV